MKSARLAGFAIPLSCALTGCAGHRLYEKPEAEVVSHGCNDVVVIGRVKTVDGIVLDDWLSRFSVRVTIKRVLRGRESRRVVPANRIAHGQLVDDRDFLLALSPAGGGYTLERATLWDVRPRPVIADPCEPSSALLSQSL
jgi:hypothetical protein